MMGLGRSLGLETVAEWVQDEQTAAMLAGWGCDYLQGDLIGRATIDRPWKGGSAEAVAGQPDFRTSPRKRGPRAQQRKNWIPACAGMSVRGRSLLIATAQSVDPLLHV